MSVFLIADSGALPSLNKIQYETNPRKPNMRLFQTFRMDTNASRRHCDLDEMVLPKGYLLDSPSTPDFIDETIHMVPL